MIKLTVQQILLIHEKQLALYGGQSGFIDENLFYSQCKMPYQTFGGEELFPDVYDKAVRYLFGFATNQVFCDGNKRTGVAVMLIFLDVNGIEIIATNDELTKFGLEVANKQYTEEQAKQFLIAHTK